MIANSESPYDERAQATVNLPVVSPSDEHDRSLAQLVNAGVLLEFPGYTFGSGKEVMRGQAAKLIVGILGLDSTNVKEPNFKDVPATHSYYRAIATLKDAGIIDGYQDGSFRPDEPIKRNHIAKIISRAFGLVAFDAAQLPFTDAQGEYQDAIAALYEHGVTRGKTATTFDGLVNVTLGQLATLIVRAQAVTEMELTITSITNSSIKSGDNEFNIVSTMREIFNTKNIAALSGAIVKFRVRNGEMLKILSIQLNANGTKDNHIIFDAKNASINGDITVNGDFTELKNVVVRKIILTGNIATHFAATNVEVKGELVVNEALADSKVKVNLTNVTTLHLHVKRGYTQIISNVKFPKLTVSTTIVQLDVPIEVLIINTPAKSEILGTTSIDKLTILQATDVVLKISGTIKELKIQPVVIHQEVDFQQMAQQIYM